MGLSNADKNAAVEKHPVINPSTGEVIDRIHWSTPEDVNQAVETASRAFGPWGGLTVKERVQVLFRFKQILEARLGELAGLCSSENGKTVAEARAGISKGIEVVEYATSLPQLIAGQYLEVSTGVSCRMVREPLGVVAGVTPFNFPAMVPLWIIPLALGCGNTLVLKPSEQTPLSAIRLRECLLEAGLPEGAFQLVNGARSVVEALADHPGIKALGFVGSSRVAQAVYERGTRAGKRVMAMGGAKNHLVLLPDADFEIATQNIVASFTGCCGQRCMAASVLLAVGETQRLIDGLVERVREIDPERDTGPVISAAALERITGHIDRAEADGAEVLVDGRGLKVKGKEGGFWIGPTVLDRCAPEMPAVREEIFGPVLTIVRVPKLEDALAIEKSSPYGNAAAVYTQNGALAKRCAQSFSAGMVGINIGVPVPREPFSFGGRKLSRFGYGDITGPGAIEFWIQAKKITEKWSYHANADWMS